MRRSPSSAKRLEQHTFWPLKIVRVEPPPWNTADAGGYGLGEDGHAYVLKRVETRADLPASEYLCYVIAHAIGLPVPAFTLAQVLETDEICFASREEGGLLDEMRALKFWSGADQPAFWDAHALPLARWLAFDQFSRNVDRHCGNFLLRANGFTTAIIGIDFSRALLSEGWPNKHTPLPAGCNTMVLANTICRAHGKHYPHEEAVRTIHRLASIPDDWIDERLDALASTLATDKLKRQIMRWWRAGRQRRLRALRRHLANGRYVSLLPAPSGT